MDLLDIEGRLTRLERSSRWRLVTAVFGVLAFVVLTVLLVVLWPTSGSADVAWYLGVEQVIAVLSALAWPATVIIVCAVFRPELEALMRRIRKLEGFGMAANLGEEQSVTTVSEAKVAGPPALEAPSIPVVTPMEKKIMLTLWTKQVNRLEGWPHSLWIFRPDPIEWPEFYTAVGRLMTHRFVGKLPDQTIHLTIPGFLYARDRFTEFGEDQWWPEEKLREDKLALARQWNPPAPPSAPPA